MKRTILTLIFALIGLVTHSQVIVKNQTTLDDNLVNHVVNYTCNELQLNDSILIVIAPKKFNTDILIRGDHACVTRVNKGYYLINIDDNIHTNTAIKSIIHELAHVKQFEDNRLRIIGNIKVYFDGKLYEQSYLQLQSYDNYPWEIEANDLEKTIYKSYKKH